MPVNRVHCFLFSVYEADTQILSVIKSTDYKKIRQKEDYVLISNDKNADYDCLFTELNFAQSIEDFFYDAERRGVWWSQFTLGIWRKN